jgi:hypothetical protein
MYKTDPVKYFSKKAIYIRVMCYVRSFFFTISDTTRLLLHENLAMSAKRKQCGICVIIAEYSENLKEKG